MEIYKNYKGKPHKIFASSLISDEALRYYKVYDKNKVIEPGTEHSYLVVQDGKEKFVIKDDASEHNTGYSTATVELQEGTPADDILEKYRGKDIDFVDGVRAAIARYIDLLEKDVSEAEISKAMDLEENPLEEDSPLYESDFFDDIDSSELLDGDTNIDDLPDTNIPEEDMEALFADIEGEEVRTDDSMKMQSLLKGKSVELLYTKVTDSSKIEDSELDYDFVQTYNIIDSNKILIMAGNYKIIDSEFIETELGTGRVISVGESHFLVEVQPPGGDVQIVEVPFDETVTRDPYEDYEEVSEDSEESEEDLEDSEDDSEESEEDRVEDSLRGIPTEQLMDKTYSADSLRNKPPFAVMDDCVWARAVIDSTVHDKVKLMDAMRLYRKLKRV